MSIPIRNNSDRITAEWFNSIRQELLDLVVSSITVTSNYTVTADINTIFADTSSNGLTITLPNAALNPDKKFTIICKDASNNCFIDSVNGSIMGEPVYQLRMDYETITVISDGVKWYGI